MTSISDTNVVNAPGGLVELGYATRTTDFTATTTNPNLIFSPNLTVVCDGSPVLVEFGVPRVDHSSANPYNHLTGLIRVDGVDQTRLFERVNWNSGLNQSVEMYTAQKLTPAAGVRTFNINCYVHTTGASNSGLLANAWGNVNPIWMRVSKIIQASQLIVQTPNAPLVTSLPSNAIDGQEVRYLADNTNGIIWNFRYRAGSSSAYKWEFIGGRPLSVGTPYSTESTASASYVDLASGPQISIPLAGDYDIMIQGNMTSSSTGWGAQSYAIGTATASDDEAIWTGVAGPGYQNSGMAQRRKTITTAGTILTMKYKSPQSISIGYAYRRFDVTPVRVSA